MNGAKNSILGKVALAIVVFLYPISFILGVIDILRNSGMRKTCAYIALVISTFMNLMVTYSAFAASSVPQYESMGEMKPIYTIGSIIMVCACIFLIPKVKRDNELALSPDNIARNNTKPATNPSPKPQRQNATMQQPERKTKQVSKPSRQNVQSVNNSSVNNVSNNNSSFDRGPEVRVTNEALADSLIQSKIYSNVNPNNEEAFAEQVLGRMRSLLSSYGVSANVTAASARCGNVRHPMVEVWNEKYGALGLMVNKNMIQVIRLRYGQVTEMMYRQEQLRNASSGYKTASKWNAVGTAGSVVGMGSSIFREHDAFNPFDGCGVGGCSAILGTFNCLSGLAKSSKAKKMQKEADRIQYDPSDLAFEQAWENDVMKCFNQI